MGQVHTSVRSPGKDRLQQRSGATKSRGAPRLAFVISLALAAALGIPVTGCSSSGGSHSGSVGSGCSSNADCGSGLFCFSGGSSDAGRYNNDVFDGLCTMNCASSTTDICAQKYANTECAGIVCAADCGNGLTCPSGSSCDQNQNDFNANLCLRTGSF